MVIVNNNPETVSTDFDTADRLYFEPLTPEDVHEHHRHGEARTAVVVAFGGQTAIKLTKYICRKRASTFWAPQRTASTWPRTGSALTSCWSSCDIKRPEGYDGDDDGRGAGGGRTHRVSGADAALLCAGRPEHDHRASTTTDIREYMAIILAQNIENPVLIDKYLMGIELEVDAICDGEDILIPGIMEHVERAGIHSGDSIAVYPAWNVGGSTDPTVSWIAPSAWRWR